MNEYRIYKTAEDYNSDTNGYDIKAHKVLLLTERRKHLLALRGARLTKRRKIFLAVLNGLSFNQASKAFDLSQGRTREIFFGELRNATREKDIKIRNVFDARLKKDKILATEKS